MNTLFIHIKELLQTRPKSEVKVMGDSMKELPHIKNAFLRIQGDTILDFGAMADLVIQETDEVIDVTGRIILPSWCDSHSHVVYAGDRSQEFVDRLNGLSYEDIAAKGGGILNSAQTLQATSEEALFEQSMERVNALIQLGTGALEIKSGYGLSPEAELKMLRVIKAIKGTSSLKIKATFLGAHAIPKLYKTDKQAYIDLIPKIEKSSVQKVIFVSSTSVYADTNGTITDTENFKINPAKQRLIDLENLFRNNKHFDCTVLRFSGLVGGSRNPGNFFKEGRIVKNGLAPVNLIHLKDCIHIVYQILKKKMKGQ